MQCMKCGKSTSENQVFCESCLQIMDAYPVKPDAAINLPNRTNPSPSKKAPRKKPPTPEEQIAHLKKTARRLRITCLVMVLLLALTTFLLVWDLTRPEQSAGDLKGQNFTFAPASADK